MWHLSLSLPWLELPGPISFIPNKAMIIIVLVLWSLHIFFMHNRPASICGRNKLITSVFYMQLQGALIPKHFQCVIIHSQQVNNLQERNTCELILWMWIMWILVHAHWIVCHDVFKYQDTVKSCLADAEYLNLTNDRI